MRRRALRLCKFCEFNSRREPIVIRTLNGKTPKIPASAYVDASAVVLGDVVLGEDASVWPCAVIRGDTNSIRIGARTNVQDGSVFHGDFPDYPLTLGDEVTVGHGAILHGCTIESRCLIGMGSTILNGAKIGTGSIIAAGTLVTEHAQIPPGSMVMGHPGKVRRAVTPEEQAKIGRSAAHYVELQREAAESAK
jgi:carbonic anhydrase/acetyltransferase-like protein (isoleucine patch superfamily)